MHSALVALHAPALSPRDEAGRLEDAIATLAAHVASAEHRLLQLIAEYDAREYWAAGGFRSCAAWLSWRIGLDGGAARERVRVARALPALPQIAAALEAGRISYSKVRALTRVATPELEQELLEIALHGTAHHVEKVCRLYRRARSVAESELAAQQHSDGRYLRSRVDDDGMVVIEARLSPLQGALVLRALERAQRREEAERQGVPAETCDAMDEPTPEQRRADALERVACSALASEMARGECADHVQVVLHVDERVLQPAGSSRGCCHLEDAGALPEATALGLSCDAAMVTVRHGEGDRLIDVARKTRVVSPALRRALRGRQPACAFPGCSCTRYLEAHHIVHWAHGGETSLENLVLLCSHHHRALHEGRFRLRRLADGAVEVVAANQALAPVPRMPEGDWTTLVDDPSVDASTMPTWRGERCDYDWAVAGLLRTG
ncbi:MAG: DUF222 domain-containing protein [Myxococcales bacterium]|nr:DUF222 domain-containing protein [Myxococcales bacterium]